VYKDLLRSCAWAAVNRNCLQSNDDDDDDDDDDAQLLRVVYDHHDTVGQVLTASRSVQKHPNINHVVLDHVAHVYHIRVDVLANEYLGDKVSLGMLTC
jgi:hypothetical protein